MPSGFLIINKESKFFIRTKPVGNQDGVLNYLLTTDHQRTHFMITVFYFSTSSNSVHT